MLNEAFVLIESTVLYAVNANETLVEDYTSLIALIETINEENPFWVLACGSLQTETTQNVDFASFENGILTVQPEGSNESGLYTSAVQIVASFNGTTEAGYDLAEIPAFTVTIDIEVIEEACVLESVKFAQSRINVTYAVG